MLSHVGWLQEDWRWEGYRSLATTLCACLSKPCLSLLGEEAFEGIVVVLVKCCVNQGIEERVGVAKPQEYAFPEGGQVACTEGADELCQEEGDPAQHKHTNEDAHHQGRPLLLLLPPRVPAHRESHRWATCREHHLSLLRCLLHLERRNVEFKNKTTLDKQSAMRLLQPWPPPPRQPHSRCTYTIIHQKILGEKVPETR